MLPNKPWTRQKLTQMLYHAFIGSLADNAIEIGWAIYVVPKYDNLYHRC